MSVKSIPTPASKQDTRADSVVRAPQVGDPGGPEVRQPFDRYGPVRQYSLRQILGVWAAAAIPMGLLAWIVAPWLSDQIGGRDPFIESLLICFNVGLLWQLAMVLYLVRREQGSLAWSRVRDALWLRAPQDPKSGRVGKKVWWWVVPFVVLSAAFNALPIDPVGPLPRDLPQCHLDGPCRGLLQRQLGWVRAAGRGRHPGSSCRGAGLPWTAVAANARRLRKGRFRRQRCPAHALPRAPAVEHASHPAGQHLRPGLSH